MGESYIHGGISVGDWGGRHSANMLPISMLTLVNEESAYKWIRDRKSGVKPIYKHPPIYSCINPSLDCSLLEIHTIIHYMAFSSDLQTAIADVN